MVERHTIETYGPQPNNRNIWPHNSRATVFCHAWPILLSVLHPVVIPLLVYDKIMNFIFNRPTLIFTVMRRKWCTRTSKEGDKSIGPTIILSDLNLICLCLLHKFSK